MPLVPREAEAKGEEPKPERLLNFSRLAVVLKVAVLIVLAGNIVIGIDVSGLLARPCGRLWLGRWVVVAIVRPRPASLSSFPMLFTETLLHCFMHHGFVHDVTLAAHCLRQQPDLWCHKRRTALVPDCH